MDRATRWLARIRLPAGAQQVLYVLLFPWLALVIVAILAAIVVINVSERIARAL